VGISQIPAAGGGGGIKSVQRGSAGSATSVTITAVDTAKSFVHTFPTASSGDVSMGQGSWNGQNQVTSFYGSTIALGTSQFAKKYGAYLSNSTTLVTTGACRWEVVEFA
jgi:hypothetical protein